MKKILLLILIASHSAMANPEDNTAFSQEMDFLKQNSFIESDQLNAQATNQEPINTETELEVEVKEETATPEFVDLDKKFFSDEISLKKSAPKRRAHMEENFIGDEAQMSSSTKNDDESQKIDKPSFFKRLLNNDRAKKIDGSINPE